MKEPKIIKSQTLELTVAVSLAVLSGLCCFVLFCLKLKIAFDYSVNINAFVTYCAFLLAMLGFGSASFSICDKYELFTLKKYLSWIVLLLGCIWSLTFIFVFTYYIGLLGDSKPVGFWGAIGLFLGFAFPTMITMSCGLSLTFPGLFDK